MNKKLIIIIVCIVVLLIGSIFVFKKANGPSVSLNEQESVSKYALSYLTDRYGEHNFKVIGLKYEYNMNYMFDHSNPIGYKVIFKSDDVKNSFLTIYGMDDSNYLVKSDYYIESYYYPDLDGYDSYETMKGIQPKKKLGTMFLNDILNEFDSHALEAECEESVLNIPEGYGKVPTLDDLKEDTNLYIPLSFTYKVTNTISDAEEYKNNLLSYVKNKYSKYIDYKKSENVDVFVNPGKFLVRVSF